MLAQLVCVLSVHVTLVGQVGVPKGGMLSSFVPHFHLVHVQCPCTVCGHVQCVIMCNVSSYSLSIIVFCIDSCYTSIKYNG